MDETARRLTTCFEGVFPDVPPADIPAMSQRTHAAWDSIATITLASVLEEEFGFQVDFERLPELDSFDQVLAYVRSETGA